MIKIGQYLKSKVSNLIIRVTEVNSKNRVSAVVIVPISTKPIGRELSMVHAAYFAPYTPTQQELIEWGETTTLTNDNLKDDTMDVKDINLRLECLKLAIELKPIDPVLVAQEFYNWITQKL